MEMNVYWYGLVIFHQESPANDGDASMPVLVMAKILREWIGMELSAVMVFQDVSGSWRSPVWWWWYLLKLCMVRRSSVCGGPSFQCWWRHPTSITEMWNDMVICDSIKMSPVDDGSSSVLVMDEWYVMNGLFLHGMTSTIDDGCDWPWRWNIKMVWFGGAFKWWKLSS